MKIIKSALIEQRHNKAYNKDAISVLKRADEINKNNNAAKLASTPKDILKHVRMLLIENKLSLEDVIKKYKEIAYGEVKGTRVSDIIKVLENVQRIHLTELNSLESQLDHLNAKDPEELAEYTQVTLRKTEIILQKIKAKRINEANGVLESVPERA